MKEGGREEEGEGGVHWGLVHRRGGHGSQVEATDRKKKNGRWNELK